MKHTIFICLIGLFFAGSGFANNSFLVAPGIVEFDLTKPGTQSFIITNNGDETIRLNIQPVYFEIDDHTLAMGEHLEKATREIENITDSIRVSPKRLSLNPGQKRNIRIAIRPDRSLEAGAYRSHLLVQMLEVARVIRTDDTQDSDGVGMNINIKMETAVAIIGNKGEGVAQLEFFCRKNVDNGQLLVKIINPTIWRFDGQISLSENNRPIFNKRLVSLRGSTKSRVLQTRYNPSADYQFSYTDTKQPEQQFDAGCRAL